jgi:hypothetical protein
VGIASIEDQRNWTFFLENLKSAIPSINSVGMVIMHDREKGLHAAQVVVCPLAHESICAFHLEKNLNIRFKSKFEGLIWKATKSTTSEEYETAIDGIQQANSNAVEYLMASNPSTWASQFPVPRFGCTTSNSAESMNSWMEKLRAESYFKILWEWICTVGLRQFEQKQIYDFMTPSLPVATQTRYNQALAEGRRRELPQVSDNAFQVSSSNAETIRTVQHDVGRCSCGKFQELQFPCCHAADAIRKVNGVPLNYMDSSYSTESLRETDAVPGNPVDVENLSDDGITLPPPATKKVGRPRTLRIRSRGETDPERQLTCSMSSIGAPDNTVLLE